MAADSAVKQYCKRQLETGLYTWYPPQIRLGGEAIVVPETPLLCYVLTGSVSQNANTITGLSSTTNLLVGMTAQLATGANSQTTQPFANAATITAISTNSVTISGSGATYAVTGGTWVFGCAVWCDPNGSFGEGPGTDSTGPFGTTTLMYPGIDYSIQRDRPDGTSGSGKIIRLSSAFGLFGMGGIWNPASSAWNLYSRGTLSGPLNPLWSNWPPGSVQIMYAAGYGVGATPPNGLMPNPTTIPYDLTAATTLLAAWMWRNADTGGMQYQSESYQGYSGNLAMPIDALKQDAELGSTRQLLSRYRRVAIG